VVIDNELFIAAGGAGAWNREYSHGSISQMGKRSDKFEFDNRDARSAGQRNPYPILYFFISEAIIVWIRKISHSYGQGGASFYQSATSLNPKCKSDPKTRAEMIQHPRTSTILSTGTAKHFYQRLSGWIHGRRRYLRPRRRIRWRRNRL